MRYLKEEKGYYITTPEYNGMRSKKECTFCDLIVNQIPVNEHELKIE